MIVLLGAALPAHAASLDQLEVAGLQGTPATDGAASVWWNPAMMSHAGGTRILAEGAPIFGGLNLDRDSPIDPGRDEWRVTSFLPFLGLVTDAGVKGLGLGVSLQVPYGRGGQSRFGEEGPGRTHLVNGQIQTIQISGGVSYAVTPWLGLGLAGTYVNATYQSVHDQALLPDLADAIVATAPILGQPQDLYPPSAVEDPNYLIRTDLGKLTGHGGAVQVGIWGKPTDKLTLSASFYSGTKIVHEGPAHLDFGCPPESDPIGRAGAQSEGLCNAKVDAYATNTYWYPMRANFGIRYDPKPGTQVELMGGWVRWSQYHDFDFQVSQAVKTNVGPDSPDLSARARGLIESERLWARGNKDSFWIGADAKVQVHDLVWVDGRVVFDRRAVQPGFLSPNTADFDTVKLGAGLEVRTGRLPLFVGVSFIENIAVTRHETDNRFRIDLDPAQRVEQRLFYPQMNGTYSGYVHRLGISVRTVFGGKKQTECEDGGTPER